MQHRATKSVAFMQRKREKTQILHQKGPYSIGEHFTTTEYSVTDLKLTVLEQREVLINLQCQDVYVTVHKAMLLIVILLHTVKR